MSSTGSGRARMLRTSVGQVQVSKSASSNAAGLTEKRLDSAAAASRVTRSSMRQSEISRKLVSGGLVHSNEEFRTCSNMNDSPIAEMIATVLMFVCGER